MKKDTSKPAFPTLGTVDRGQTLREYYAGLVMQGLNANPEIGYDAEETAAIAVEYADALIRRLSE